jgi:hypothetical protein
MPPSSNQALTIVLPYTGAILIPPACADDAEIALNFSVSFDLVRINNHD